METSPLPVDILLEILARSDPPTVACTVTTCKLLRRHATVPAFLRRLGLGSSNDGHFLLALLFHRHVGPQSKKTLRRRPVFTPPTSFPGWLPKAVVANVSAELAGSRDPVASRGGLLVLRSEEEGPSSRLCVCDPAAGRRHVLPPKAIRDSLHVLLPEDEEEGRQRHGGAQFKLLVADLFLRTQTYSSRAGAWGRVVATATPAHVPADYRQAQASPVVLGGVAHWLYCQRRSTRLFRVLALDAAGTGRAEWIVVPDECHSRRVIVTEAEMPGGELLLVASPDGELGLLVSERPVAVTMWTVAAESGGRRSWARRVVIDWEAILGSVNFDKPLACQRVELASFAEGSGTVVLKMERVGIVLLNLRTLEVRHLQMQLFESSPFCVYELDLGKLLRSLR